MIRKQVIRYENATVLEATWVDAGGNVLRCHAYDATQMDNLREDIGEDVAQYEEMIQQCLADYTPPDPSSIEEQNAQILFEISSLERQYLMPRITREATILQLETWALSQGYPLEQFRVANKGYRGLKELDERIIYLRGQLK